MAERTVEDVRHDALTWAKEHWDPDMVVADWWKALAAAGYASPMLPVALGGKGYGRVEAMAVNQALAQVGAVGPPMGLGLMLAAPTLAAHGSAELQAQFLPRILDGTDAWCQLFSEPGAGSDLAGLQTKAIRDGDEWIITGQKVWTSGGQIASLGMLLARTDPDAPKHQGITYFAFDVRQPGVEIRPLREMTGKAMFNEVFIDEARVPHANIIGGLNNGWAVANTTLMVERGVDRRRRHIRPRDRIPRADRGSSRPTCRRLRQYVGQQCQRGPGQQRGSREPSQARQGTGARH